MALADAELLHPAPRPEVRPVLHVGVLDIGQFERGAAATPSNVQAQHRTPNLSPLESNAYEVVFSLSEFNPG
jgi:hypothetical protein